MIGWIQTIPQKLWPQEYQDLIDIWRQSFSKAPRVTYLYLAVPIFLALIIGACVGIKFFGAESVSNNTLSVAFGNNKEANFQPPDRHLSDTEKTKIISVFSKSSTKIPLIIIGAVNYDAEAMQYAGEFADALKNAHIKTEGSSAQGKDFFPAEIQQSGTEVAGLIIGVSDEDHPSESAILFKKLLKSAGFNVPYTKMDDLADKNSFEFGVSYNPKGK